VKINQIKHCFVILWSVVCSNTVFAITLDLTGINSSDVKSHLKPVTEIITAGQTPPILFLNYHTGPYMGTVISFYSLAMTDFKSVNSGYPTLWFALSVSPNLTIGANIAGVSWLDDNIQTIGPFISTMWGTPQKSVNSTVHFHNLKGPDDFHLTDVAFDISRIITTNTWTYGYGLTAHYLNTKIHVTDNPDSSQNYNSTININNIFLRFGIYRRIGNSFDIGSEFFLNSGNMIGNLNLALNF